MKIDTNAITGFSEMSAEEKVNALLELEIETPVQKDGADEITKLKNALSRANAEASEWKKQFREKQTEQERAEAERKEHEEAVEEELKSLRRDKSVSGYLAQCIALGYSQDLALRAAEAMADGDAATLLSCQQDFLEAKTKELEAAALNKQPTLSVGTPPTAKQAEQTADDKLRYYFGLPPKNK